MIQEPKDISWTAVQNTMKMASTVLLSGSAVRQEMLLYVMSSYLTIKITKNTDYQNSSNFLTSAAKNICKDFGFTGVGVIFSFLVTPYLFLHPFVRIKVSAF